MTPAQPARSGDPGGEGGQLYLVDAIAPFFLPRCFAGGSVINWSKVPFSLLERDGAIPPDSCDRIVRRFETYARRVAGLGYNALSMDDLAHVVFFDSYPGSLRLKIEHYRRLYRRIFAIAQSRGLRVFINTDAAFALGNRPAPGAACAVATLSAACGRLFESFPEIAGVIVRLGECDGVDVSGDLRSRLAVRTAAQARRLVKELLGVFDALGRLLIVRTWSVGAYPIGDLIWNPSTYHAVFGGIESPRLIVAHKYGDTDFFRHLSLNPLIFEGGQRKLVEFQARREYEGFGEFPSFVGYDYERYRDALAGCKNLAGIHVWCQTGGWARFNRLTFLPGSSLWNEINAAVTLALFQARTSAEQAVIDYCEKRIPPPAPGPLIELLRLSDKVMKGLWYLPEYSQRALYFRRARLPPLLWVFWDTIVVSPMVRTLVRRFVRDKKEAVAEGFRLLSGAEGMKRRAAELGLEAADFDLLCATIEIIALARAYFFGDDPDEFSRRIVERARAYREAYPLGFSVHCDFARHPFSNQAMALLSVLLVRTRQRYRLIDRAILSPCAGAVFTIVKRWIGHRVPAFARERAMGIEVLLK